MARILVENCYPLHVHALVAFGKGRTLFGGVTTYGDGFEVTFAVKLEEEDRGTLGLVFHRDGEKVHQTFPLVGRPQPFGGVRWLALCNWPDEPVAKLYLPLSRRFRDFGSRDEYGLAYFSQRLRHLHRDTRRRMKPMRRLGGRSTVDTPPKPKGMHWRTYDRLMAESRRMHPLMAIEAQARVMRLWKSVSRRKCAKSRGKSSFPG